MEICIACGFKKNPDKILMNGYKEPLCTKCEKEIREDAMKAMDEIVQTLK
ncbi:hypothetical protein QU593_09990 [Rossellomorea marisflavi]|nr:hypothetical protein [Rossellomorea marisflavi]WJV20734.1 hypothetical protein QU593_09990 [Rossellomorea marisflavi]